MSPAVATTFFSITSIVAPVSGVIAGGVVTSYYGGYNTKKARELLLTIGWICVGVTIPIPIVNSFKVFGILLWALLFLGGAMLPSLTGIMLNSVKDYQRGSANSIAMTAYNLFGYIPGPTVYGLVSTIVGDEQSKVKSRIPMCFILYSVFITLIILTYVILKRLKRELQEEQLKKAEQLFQEE